MGIPKFLGAFDRTVGLKYADISRLATDVLWFDLPSLMHKAAQIAYAYGEHIPALSEEYILSIEMMSEEQREENFHNQLIKLIDNYITKSNPKRVYIYMDGVPVGAKIVQQRFRRFAATSTESQSKIPFNTNNLTVGTAFMNRLIQFLQRWVNKQPVHIEFSSALIPGEAEHKILKSMRSLSDSEQKTQIHVIQGLDTDLFLLSIIAPVKNLYLWRSDPYGKETVISIDPARISIHNYISTPNAIYSFVSALTLLGNDFVPRSISMEDFDTTIPFILNSLKEIKTDVVELIPEPRIIWREYLKIIARLASKESELLKLTSNKANFQLYNSSITNGQFDYNLFRMKFYKKIYNGEIIAGNKLLDNKVGARMDQLELLSTQMVKSYLKTVNFVTLYYFKGGEAVNKSFHYEYHYTPLLTDLFTIGKTVITDIVKEASWISNGADTYLQPSDLLIAVLPFKSFNLLSRTTVRSILRKITIDDHWKKLFPRTSIITDQDGFSESFLAPILVPIFDPLLVKTL